MGFFNKLAAVTGTMLEVKNLDIGSDMLISTVCKFEPLNVKSEYKKIITDHIRDLYINNYGESYTNAEVAIIKLILYTEMATPYPDMSKELQKGIRKIMQMEGDNLPNRTSLKAYSVMDLD